MKNKIPFYIILIGFLLSSCSKNDDNDQNNNPNIPNAAFDTGSTINTNLPQYNNLQFPSNQVVLGNYGLNGIVVFYSGIGYSAFELSDPNHQLTSCSTLTVNGLIASCDCDDGNSYEISGGLPEAGTTGQFTLVRYNVEVNGDVIRVFNN